MIYSLVWTRDLIVRIFKKLLCIHQLSILWIKYTQNNNNNKFHLNFLQANYRLKIQQVYFISFFFF